MRNPSTSKSMVGLFTGLLLFVATGSPMAPAQARPRVHFAPNFSRQTLNNQNFTLTSLRGKVVLLNFWASWCGPCRIEMPTFAVWQREYGAQGLQIVGVSMDDEERDARDIYGRYKLNYPVVMGDAKLGELYGGVLGLPVTYLIDRHGVIRYRHEGIVDLNAMEGELKTLLHASGSGMMAGGQHTQ